MSEYEKMVKRTFWQIIFFLLITIVSLLAVLISAYQFEGHSLKISLLWSGAGVAIAALIAQNRHTHFSTLLTPNTFATSAFVMVLLKYRKYQLAGSWVFLLLATLGVLVGVYGSLVG